MQMNGNTILITGGGSGIGQALAKAFHDLGNQVIITGRRQSALDETTAANPGMRSYSFDLADPAAIQSFVPRLLADFPTLNTVVHNSGVMPIEDVHNLDISTAEDTITTNLLGFLRLNTALLPHLLGQPSATILPVTSGLAFLPRASAPTYSATKAAIHSYAQALRYQLKETSVRVVEIIPPYVATTLMGEHQANDPRAMPLADYISETIGLLRDNPDADEIIVERVKPLRFAERTGTFDSFFQSYNDMVAGKKS